MKEPGAAQIILCGKFSEKEKNKIIKAHSKAWVILNNKEFVQDNLGEKQ